VRYLLPLECRTIPFSVLAKIMVAEFPEPPLDYVHDDSLTVNMIITCSTLDADHTADLETLLRMT